MQSKTYTFPAEEGTITKTLARPTLGRIEKFCAQIGVKSFAEMVTDAGMMATSISVLDLGVDRAKLADMLDTCLAEGCNGILIDDHFDATLADEVFADFFAQRARTLQSRMSA